MKRAAIILTAIICLSGLVALGPGRGRVAAQQGEKNALPPTSVPDLPANELKSRQLAEQEAALASKEQELKRYSERIDAQIRELETAKKAMEATMAVKKKVDAERYKKLLKVYKSLKPEEAAKLMDKLETDIAIEMLNQMDQKTATKLIPFLNQPRVLQWTRESLKK